MLRKESENRREVIVEQLKDSGFEFRPIAAGNCIKTKVVDYFNFEVHGELKIVTKVRLEYCDRR